MITNTIEFPVFTGIKCNMMPFIQGDDSSLPDVYKPYAKIINDNYLEKGEIGFLTIHESFVECGKSQRGYNSTGINRNVHIEVGRHETLNYWGGSGGSSWGGKYKTLLDDETMVLIANSISDTEDITSNLAFDKYLGLLAYGTSSGHIKIISLNGYELEIYNYFSFINIS
jgi:hypothetical protein